MINENVKEEEKKTVQIYTNGVFIFLKVGNKCFTPFERRQKCIIPSGYKRVDVRNVSIFRFNHTNLKKVVITTEYFDLSIEEGKCFLSMDDRGHPIYTFGMVTKISPNLFSKLLEYTFMHAEKISWDGEYYNDKNE